MSSWILGLGIIGINIYYLVTGFIGWIIHNDLPKVANVFIGLVVFPLMAVYIICVIYLVFRKYRVVTYIAPEKLSRSQDHLENGINEAPSLDTVPHREDLTDIPLPN